MGRFKIKRNTLKDAGKEVVGYFAYRLVTEVCCDGDACIVAGSMEAMKDHLKIAFGGEKEHTIKATKFEEILKGMKLGAAYSFDKEAYDRFRLVASRVGMDIGNKGLSSGTEMKFIRVQLVASN